jgi:Cu(I)/Ag(I) efflux system membrane fusion protein
MKTTTLVSVCTLAGAVIAVGAYQLGARGHSLPGMATSSSREDVKLDPQTGRRVLYWHDPMVPGTKFDKSGKSPFMEMQLVPVYADEAAGPGVTVNPGVAQNLGIRTALVRKAELSATLDAVGVVTQNERATEVVQSRVTGYVEKLHVRAVLDPVRKGQPLVTLYAPEWAAALEEYLGVRQAQPGPALVDAARARLRLLSIPDGIITRSEQLGVAQTRFTLSAPTSGVVAELGIREGAMVSPGMTLFRIADLSAVWVMAEVPESQASQVGAGTDAEVRLVGGGNAFVGKVSAILPDVDAATRTLKARVELRNPGQVLKPGMFARVTFKSSAAGQALLIPQEAVIATGQRNVVIVAGEAGKYSPVEVQLGRVSGGDIEVKTGLVEGQRVVSSGQFLLDSEASLKSGLSRLAASASPPTPDRHAGEGKVEAIGRDDITISHDPIASLKWGPMTMPFKSPKGRVPAGLSVGARVQFEFVQQGDDYVLESLKPLKPVPGGTKP